MERTTSPALTPLGSAQALGATSPEAQGAASAIQAFSRAARSFVLYDSDNAVVRQFLGEYQAKLREVLDKFGDIKLDIHPFEMQAVGEVIYRDSDREKSLSFKLYRDGIRKLTIRQSVTWEELLKLLEILAVRFSGVRQQEDDTLTLLRKAEFRGIALQAVEGFTPDEEDPEPDNTESQSSLNSFRPPDGWDTPLAELPEPGPIAYVPIEERLLAPLRVEDDERSIARLALSVARDLLAEAAEHKWPLPDADITAFFTELRDGLLAEGESAALARLVDLLKETGNGDLSNEVLNGMSDGKALDRILASVPEEMIEVPPDVLPLIGLVNIDAALDQLAVADSPNRQKLLTSIVLARLPEEAKAVVARLSTFEPTLAKELGHGLIAKAPTHANEVARQFLDQPDEAMRLEGLSALESALGDVPLKPLCELLNDKSLAMRIRAAEVLGKKGDESVGPLLQEKLEDSRSLDPKEADAIGRALGRVVPEQAAKLFQLWREPPRRLLRKPTPHQLTQQWAAVSGTGVLAGPEPELILTVLAEKSEEDVRRHCFATLARRRKEARESSTARPH